MSGGGGLPPETVGAKTLGVLLEAQGRQTCWRVISWENSRDFLDLDWGGEGEGSNTVHKNSQEPKKKKEPQSQKDARTAPKNFLNNSRGFPVMTH